MYSNVRIDILRGIPNEFRKWLPDWLKHSGGVGKRLTDTILAAKLHDIGKVGIPEHILNKSGPLTQEEYEQIKSHPGIGEAILSPIERLRPIARIVRHHHERVDGGGYPDGLRGKDIPVESRLVAIVDAFDAMTSARPYRGAIPAERAAEEIRKKMGKQFDSDLSACFLDLFDSGHI
ncbi:MAG TPA: HD domain-containing protein [Firmicutes bacterium]|nr:HD domain-containing protein [Bacillota bacterium]